MRGGKEDGVVELGEVVRTKGVWWDGFQATKIL